MVTVNVEVPKRLSKDEKRILEEFSRLHTASPREHLGAHMHETEKA